MFCFTTRVVPVAPISRSRSRGRKQQHNHKTHRQQIYHWPHHNYCTLILLVLLPLLQFFFLSTTTLTSAFVATPITAKTLERRNNNSSSNRREEEDTTNKSNLPYHRKTTTCISTTTTTTAIRMASSSTASSPSPPSTSPKRRRQHLVLVGGGHSHVQVIKGLNHYSEARQQHDFELEITVIDVADSPVYSGMVPGTVAGIYAPHESCILLRPLCDWAHIQFIQDRVIDINVETKTITTAATHHGNTKRMIPFDVISVDIGSTSRGLDSIPGAKQYCIPTRPISELVTHIEFATDKLTQAAPTPSYSIVNVIVVGGGAAGVELSMNILGRWEPIVGTKNIQVTLLNSSPILFPDEPTAIREALLHQLEQRGIRIINHASVKEVQQDSMTVQVTQQPQSELGDVSDDVSGDKHEHERERDSSRIVVYEFTHCVWATGADCPPPLSSSLRENGQLALSDRGWIEVNDCFQSISHPYVFASGDCCSMKSSSPPSPKAGVYAVRAGPILLENLTRYLLTLNNDNDTSSSHLQAYVPQTDFLKLIGCGDGTAQGFRFGIPFYGKWVFQLKNAIDRIFVDGFKQENLPELLLDDDGQQVYDASQQFDTVPDDHPSPDILPPIDAVLLLQRTDDYVDYQQAWDILREMTKNKTYREEVVACYHQSIHPPAE